MPKVSVNGRKARVAWDEQEILAVSDKIVDLLLDRPHLPDSELLEQGQSVLDDNRRRNFSGFSQAPRLLKQVQIRLAQVKQAAESAKQHINECETLQKLRLEGHKLIESLQTEVKQLKATIQQLQTQPTPEQVLATTPPEKLLHTLLIRYAAVTADERGQLTTAATALERTRQLLEERMGRMENRLNLVMSRQDLAAAPAQTVVKPEYMPLIVVAGTTRQEFQRLQHTVTNTSVRLIKLDTTKRNQIAVPAHDRLILWSNGLTEDLTEHLNGRSTKVRHVRGAAAHLAEAVIEEARAVREEKQAPMV